MFPSANDVLLLSDLPSDIILTIIRMGIASIDKMRLISRRWEVIVLDYLSVPKRLPAINLFKWERTRLFWTVTVHVPVGLQGFFGMDTWKPVKGSVTDKEVKCTLFESIVKTKWLKRRLERLFLRCSRVENFELVLKDESELKALNKAMKDVIVDKFVVEVKNTAIAEQSMKSIMFFSRCHSVQYLLLNVNGCGFNYPQNIKPVFKSLIKFSFLPPAIEILFTESMGPYADTADLRAQWKRTADSMIRGYSAVVGTRYDQCGTLPRVRVLMKRFAHTPVEWTELYGTPQTLLGLWSLTFATICQILYFPSLHVFYRERKMTCYKIVHFLALADFGGVTCVGSLFGFTMLQGLVYCSDVTLSWVMGGGVCCCWYVSTGTCALLVINRIGELMQLAKYFQGWRSSFCMAIILVYGVMGTLFTRLVYPNSPHTTVAFEPFIPGHTVEEYPNNFNMMHNFCVAFFIPSLYIAYSLIVRWKASSFEASTITQKLQAQIFTQASIICFFNVTTASAWIIQMFVPTPQVIITAGMITIQSVHGLPCIIYIVLNRNVRDELRRIIGANRKDGSGNGFTTAVNPSVFMSTATAISTQVTVI